MHKLRRRIVSDNSTKKARLLHGCNLALLGLLLCTTLLSGMRAAQERVEDPVKRTEVLSYEGQKISSIELAGRPDLKIEGFMPLVAQNNGENFSACKVEQTVAALQATGRFKDVQLDLRPEQEGVRVILILQPAMYFGMYQFPGAEKFAYARLLQVANYSPQEPYSQVDL